MVIDERVSGWYLAVFLPLMIVGTAAAAFGAGAEAAGWLPALLAFFQLEAPVAVGSTGLAFAAVQIGGLVVFWLETALKKRDAERKKLRAAALAEGRAAGLEQGREQGLEQGREQGREQGLEQGREQGLERGLAAGREQGRTEAYAAFADWDTRRRAAEAQGNEFTEPPPYRNSAGT